MQLVINSDQAEANGNFGAHDATLAVELEGRKRWLNAGRLRFEATEANVRLFKGLFPAAEVTDFRPLPSPELGPASGPGLHGSAQPCLTTANPAGKALEPAQNSPFQPLGDLSAAPGTQPRPAPGLAAPAQPQPSQPGFVLTPRPFQLANFERFKNKRFFAIFSDPGTGKTKTAIDIISHRFLAGTLQNVLIFAPDGVHIQWLIEQFPQHLWQGIPLRAQWWDKKNMPYWLAKPFDGKLRVFAANVDMVKSSTKFDMMKDIIAMMPGKTLLLIDESHLIKNASAVRSKRLTQLGQPLDQRAIMTGTPLATNLLDEWAQFKFLDERIIGIKYKVAFQNQFCRMGGFQNKKVIGHRNLEEFKRITAPHIFRATKAELNLPEPVFDRIVFEMSDEQKDLIKELKATGAAQLAGNQLDIWNAAVLALRMQQISCGFVRQDEKTIPLKENPRLEALQQFLESTDQKVIVWCRFQFDIRTIAKVLGKQCVTCYGPDDASARQQAKLSFIQDKSVKWFVANPAVAGTGTDGLQSVCSTAVYYSNSFKYIDRRQSEDRIDRIGSLGAASYFDLIARGGPDNNILANLRGKRSLSELSVDDWRGFFEEGQL